MAAVQRRQPARPARPGPPVQLPAGPARCTDRAGCAGPAGWRSGRAHHSTTAHHRTTTAGCHTPGPPTAGCLQGGPVLVRCGAAATLSIDPRPGLQSARQTRSTLYKLLGLTSRKATENYKNHFTAMGTEQQQRGFNLKSRAEVNSGKDCWWRMLAGRSTPLWPGLPSTRRTEAARAVTLGLPLKQG